ncbi:MAG: ATP-binding protein [Deltaproteobacteria bacterium]|nr:ATP-binding protein [Deltaproteobacteria bacterium]
MVEKADTLFPEWLPSWAHELGRVYYTGNISTFILHGNVDDLVRVELPDGRVDYIPPNEFVASQIFGSWDLVLHYDLTGPPHALAASDQDRLQRMNAHIDRHIGRLGDLPRDPTKVLALLNRYLEIMLAGKSDDTRPSVAMVLDYAHLLLPRTPSAQMSHSLAANLVTVLNWAKNTYIKRVNFAFCLITERLSDLHDALVRSAHTHRVDLSFPAFKERLAFIEWMRGGRDFDKLAEVSPEGLAKLTAGLTLVNIRGLLQTAIRHEQRITLDWLKHNKKEMIEGACQGLVEFVEPAHNLDMVVGHEAAKRRLRDDASLIKHNHLEAAPMGYLLSGPVGTGKSFLAECYAGSVGIPCLKLLNFRSKYVGETEGNLEKILKVLRMMGPVLVIIDEADAALGDRDSGGDSGTSSRVFGQIASQMGNTAYRGKIIWFLMTARPDLLPIDIKRQGRAEVHIPLFYPQTEDEKRQMFVVMGKKNGVAIRPEDVPEVGEDLKLSGADVEGVVTRAWRLSLLAESEGITKEHLAQALEGFIPSAQDAEKQMQELAAVLECTEAEMLPEDIRQQVRTGDGKLELTQRFERLRLQVEAH